MTPVVGDWVDFKIDDNGDGYILKFILVRISW